MLRVMQRMSKPLPEFLPVGASVTIETMFGEALGVVTGVYVAPDDGLGGVFVEVTVVEPT